MIRRMVEPRPNAEPQPELELKLDDNGAPYTAKSAFAYCERIARGHYENFPVASRFLPAELRRHVWAIYAFARSADDFADEPRYRGRRKEALDLWEANLERAFHGEAEHPIFVALRETFGQRNVPISPLRDLLTAFNMDLSVKRYPTFASLERYIQHSAHPVGRLVLYIFNYADPTLHRYSDDLCAALELTHFVQDLALNLARDRIYLPEEDLHHFGVNETLLFSLLGPERRKVGELPSELAHLLRFEVARARSLYERGRPLIEKVGAELGFELAMIWNGGMAILDKIEAVGYDVFRRRPQLGAADKARLVARAASQRWPHGSGANLSGPLEQQGEE